MIHAPPKKKEDVKMNQMMLQNHDYNRSSHPHTLLEVENIENILWTKQY